EATSIENVIADIGRVAVQPQPDAIGRRLQLLHARVDQLCANMVSKHPDHFGGIKVISDQPHRLKTMRELGTAAPPSVKARALLERGAAALRQVGKTEARSLLKPGREAGGCTLPHSDGWNGRVEHVQQLRLREVPRQMRGGNKPGRTASEHRNSHTATSMSISGGRRRCCTAKRAWATSGLDGAAS